MKHVNDHQIRDYDIVLDSKYGCPGTEERIQFEDEAMAFYTGSILKDARRQEKVTQSELAERLGTNKSYISKIENGSITPSAAMFYRIIGALGLEIRITRPAVRF